jgi:O-antigen ligase
MFGVAIVFIESFTASYITDTLGRDATLTGRTYVWSSLLPEATQNIVTGHGFGGFWITKSRINFDISDAHNGYLDILLDMGIIGLLLVSIFLLSCCRKAKKRLAFDFYWAGLWISYLFMAVCHNITETSLNSLASHIPAVIMFMAVSSSVAPAVSDSLYAKYRYLLLRKKLDHEKKFNYT